MKISFGRQLCLLSLYHKQTAVGAGDNKLLITNLPGSRRQAGQGSLAKNFSAHRGTLSLVTAQQWESYFYFKVIACQLTGGH